MAILAISDCRSQKEQRIGLKATHDEQLYHRIELAYLEVLQFNCIQLTAHKQGIQNIIVTRYCVVALRSFLVG